MGSLLFALPLRVLPSFGCIPVVLYGVLCSSRDVLCYFSPSVSYLLMCFNQQPLFFFTPCLLLHKTTHTHTHTHVKSCCSCYAATVQCKNEHKKEESRKRNLDIRAKMVMPSFPALLPNPADQLLRNLRPFPDTMLLHQFTQ